MIDHPSPDRADDLQRLVCFAAAALDVPYAYVAARAPSRRAGQPSGLTVWLARDYGLKFEFAHVYGFDGDAATAGDYAEALNRTWPDAPGLGALLARCAPGVPLHDSRGALLGHLAVLNPLHGCESGDAVRLQPLAEAAAVKLVRWVEGEEA